MQVLRSLVGKTLEWILGAKVPDQFVSWESIKSSDVAPEYRCEFFEREIQEVERVAWP